MANIASDGLARIQGESRISANTWRQWSSRLGLDPDDVVELWDEVCHPLMVASGSAPDIAFVMQLRSIRSDLYIEEFRDEVPAALLTSNLLDSLHDDRLSGAKSKSAILKFCQHMATADPGCEPELFRRRLVVDLCTAILLARVMPGDGVSLSRLVRLLVEGRATLDKLAALVLKSTAEESYADLVRACLQTRRDFEAGASQPQASAVENADDDDDGGDDAGDDDAVEAEASSEEDDEGDAEDEEEDDYEDDEDEDDLEDDASGDKQSGPDSFLSAFNAAMEAIYQTEASELDLSQDNRDRLAGRLGAISQFHPLRSRIPSMEEAQKLNRKPGGNDSGRQRALDRARAGSGKSAPRPVMTARPSRSGGAGSSGAGSSTASSPSTGSPGTGPSGGGSAALAAGAGTGSGTPSGARKSSAVIKAAAAGGGDVAGTVSSSEEANQATASAPGDISTSPESEAEVTSGAAEPSAAPDTASGPASIGQRIVVEEVPLHELSKVVSRIGQLLSLLEELDPGIWELLCEPAAEIPDPRQLAEDLLTDDSGAQQAYGAIRIVADKQALKRLLQLPPDRRLNERRFDLELTCFLNTVNNSRRGFEPDSRQLISLPKVLDYAAAVLVRLEALRTALAWARESGVDFDAAAAIAQYDEVLTDVTYMAEQELVVPVRERADTDAAAVGEAVVADLTIDRMVAESCEYARQLEADGHTATVEAVDEAVGAASLQFEGIEPGEELPGQLPAQYSEPTKLGEVHDRVRSYVFERVWPLLQPRHRPEETAARLDAELREALKGTIRMEPRRERHQKNPKVALAVVSLETLTGNAELGHLFVRVSVDGKLLYIEDFEDGTYLDLFERRKNTKRQMHARARDRAEGDSSGELQMGSNYLYSVGRTNTPFGRTQNAIMKGCVLNESDEPVIYPIF